MDQRDSIEEVKKEAERLTKKRIQEYQEELKRQQNEGNDKTKGQSQK